MDRLLRGLGTRFTGLTPQQQVIMRRSVLIYDVDVPSLLVLFFFLFVCLFVVCFINSLLRCVSSREMEVFLDTIRQVLQGVSLSGIPDQHLAAMFVQLQRSGMLRAQDGDDEDEDEDAGLREEYKADSNLLLGATVASGVMSDDDKSSSSSSASSATASSLSSLSASSSSTSSIVPSATVLERMTLKERFVHFQNLLKRTATSLSSIPFPIAPLAAYSVPRFGVSLPSKYDDVFQASIEATCLNCKLVPKEPVSSPPCCLPLFDL